MNDFEHAFYLEYTNTYRFGLQNIWTLINFRLIEV